MKKYVLAGVSIAVMSSAAIAQSTVAPASTPATVGLDEIIVTATKRAERLFDVPSTISAVSGDDLQKSGGNSLSDLSRVTSGLTIGGLSNAFIVSIRGVSSSVQTAGAAQPNAIYIDGIYQQNGVLLRNQYPDIARVEVLKGPQGTLFGRNATGGAIQVITRGPSFDWTGTADVDGSYYTGAGSSASSPHVNARAFISGPIAPDLLAFSLAGSYNYIKGFYHDDGTGGTDGRSNDTYVRGKLLLTPTDNLKITVGGFQIRNNDKNLRFNSTQNPSLLFPPFIYPRNNVGSFFPGVIIPGQVWHIASDNNLDPNTNKDLFKQTGFTARAELTTDIGTLTSLTGYTKSTEHQLDNEAGIRSTAACRAAFACLDANYNTNTKEFSQEFDFASRKFGIFSFVGGLNYYYAKGLAEGDLIAPANPPIPFLQYTNVDVRTRSYAAFSEVTIAPVSKLSFVLGLRYNHEPHNDRDVLGGVSRKATFSSWTPKISAKYEVTDHLNTYATFSVGRTGGLTGVTNAGSPFGAYAPVAEEQLRSYEVGMKYATSNLTANLSGFYYDYKNKQEAVITLNPYTVNTGPVRVYGFDADLAVRITPTLSITTNASYIPYAKYRDYPQADSGFGTFLNATGLRLARSPKITGTAAISYTPGRFDSNVSLHYSSKVYQDATDIIYQSKYVTVNANIGYKLTDNIHFGIFGRNLTNRKIIRADLNGPTYALVGYDAPQEIGASLGLKF